MAVKWGGISTSLLMRDFVKQKLLRIIIPLHTLFASFFHHSCLGLSLSETTECLKYCLYDANHIKLSPPLSLYLLNAITAQEHEKTEPASLQTVVYTMH